MLSRRDALGGMGAALALPWLAGRAAAAGDAPIVVPIALDSQRVIVACGINGTGPYFFMIDSGGTMSLIDEALARELSLPAIASSRIRGVGGAANAAVYRTHDFLIGGVLQQHDLIFHGADGAGFGADIRGTLAAGALTSYDSVLDFDASAWRIYPHGFGDLAGFTPVESSVSQVGRHGSAVIIVTVGIDDQSFRCMLDTGAPSEIVLYPEAARRTRYWNDPAVHYAPVRGRGIGGQDALSRMVRAERATIGPVSFERPLVRLDGGARGQRFADGVVGLPLIRQLNLATDARRGRVLVQRNHVAPPPDHASMSGLWVDQKEGRLIVADVGRGSPAAAAGIAPGDLIVDTSFAKVLKALASGPGASVTMTIEHEGARRRATIVLADYL